MSLCKNLSRKCVRLAVLGSLVTASALAAQAQVVFSPPKNISNSSGTAQAQQIAVDKNGNANVVWVDTSLGNAAIFFSRSSDAGATFSTPVSISKHAQSTASGPQIAVDPTGNINVAWTETSPDGSANFVYFSHSADGVTFTNPQNISGDAGAATGPRIAVDSSGGVSVVWVDTSTGNDQIFFSHSADGQSFSAPLNISNDSGRANEPQIASDSGGNIFIAWGDNTPTGGGNAFPEVFFSHSADSGTTFSAPLQVTHSNNYFFVTGFSQIAVGGNGNIYLLWMQRTPYSAGALFSRSTDGGATFSAPTGATQGAGFFFATTAMMGLDPSGNDIGIVADGFDEDEPGGPFAFSGYSANAGTSFAASFFGGLIYGGSTSNLQVAVDAIGRFDIVSTFNGGYYNPGSSFSFAQSADGSEFTSGANISSFVPSAPTAMALDAGGNAYVAWLQDNNVFFSRGTVSPFSIVVSPRDVVEGNTSTGTVKLISPAPSGGAVISLSNSNPSAASVPGSVTVPEGAASATFGITTNQVSTRCCSVTISASYNGSTNTAQLGVEPLFQILFYGSMTGGNGAGGEIFVSQPAPTGGLVISLSSSNPSVASVPASVTVSAGAQYAFFSIPTTPVAVPTTVQVTGTGNGFTHGGSLTIQPATLQRLSVSPTTAINTNGSTGTITLTGPVASGGGAGISLSSSDPSATVPASVTIPAGATSASFSIATNPGSSTSAINVTISASYNSQTLSAGLTVLPVTVQQIDLGGETSVGGGGIVYANVNISAMAPAGGVVVSLSSSDPSVASLPASVTIQQGSFTTSSITINTSPVSADTTVTISATFGGVTRSATLTVQPIMLTSVLAFDIQGGASGSFFVGLNGPATSPVVVSVSSSNPSVLSVPATVTIPQGISGEGFNLTTSPVTAPTSVTITASYNGVTVSRTVTVHP